MDYLRRIPEICTADEASEFLRFTFGNAEDVASQRSIECQKAGDPASAEFWEDVRKRIVLLEKQAASNPTPTPKLELET